MNNILMCINVTIAIYVIISSKSKSINNILWLLIQILLAYFITNTNNIASIIIIEILFILECIYLKNKWKNEKYNNVNREKDH